MSSEDTEHHHPPDEERQIREAALDETIEGSFPASDPAHRQSWPKKLEHVIVRRYEVHPVDRDEPA